MGATALLCPVYHVYLMSDMLEHSILQLPHQITGHKLCLQILSIATWPWPGLGKRKAPDPTPHVLKVSPEISLGSEKGQGTAMAMHMRGGLSCWSGDLAK